MRPKVDRINVDFALQIATMVIASVLATALTWPS